MFNPSKYTPIELEIIGEKHQIKPVKEPAIKRIAVIISAYDCAEYIEQCLDSVQAQTYKHYRILLGIDGCPKTMKKVEEIRNKYDNLRVYYTKKNQGVYKMFNALIYLTEDDEWIQFFGADDYMYPYMLERMQKYNSPTVCKHVGVLFIQSKIIKEVGGFRPWRCGADADMIYRLRLLRKYNEKYTEYYYHRREHAKQLTVAKATNHKSKLRQNYMRITEENYHSENPVIYINPKKSKIKKV
jgi:glycosyltransferase involved in cell wall biosynthesis